MNGKTKCFRKQTKRSQKHNLLLQNSNKIVKCARALCQNLLKLDKTGCNNRVLSELTAGCGGCGMPGGRKGGIIPSGGGGPGTCIPACENSGGGVMNAGGNCRRRPFLADV